MAEFPFTTTPTLIPSRDAARLRASDRGDSSNCPLFSKRKDLVMTTYTPRPRDTAQVVLPAGIDALTEQLAENAHEVWAAERIAQGWTYGPRRDDATKKHPC